MQAKTSIDWFWAHRRNTSLHHMSFFGKGFRGKGWLPVVDFWFDNQIYLGVPGKGCYIFYDKKQLSSEDKYKAIQKSIDKNPHFVEDFRRRTDELFGAIFFKCNNIDEENLPLLSQEELYELYKEFIEAMTVAPIISVQLWGIEACFDEKYIIMQFLRKHLKALGREKEFQAFKETLSLNVGETVAFTEQKNFYQVAQEISKNVKLKELFQSKDMAHISKELAKYQHEDELFTKHTRKYEWMNTEYVSGGWSREKWLDLFSQAIKDKITPQEKLQGIMTSFETLNAQRDAAIKELDPPKNVLHALASLAELIAQRDWTKGYFTRALLSYHRLLDEMAHRMKTNRNDLFLYSFEELEECFLAGTTLAEGEIEKRRKYGFMLVIKSGNATLVTGKEAIDHWIKKENISDPFENITDVHEFKGFAASKGKAQGVARVLESATGISDFKEGEILITYMTTMEFTPIFRKAKAVITDEGGMSCHAAIVSREFGIPCIVGTKIATRVIKDGDLVEVDAERGIVKILKRGSERS